MRFPTLALGLVVGTWSAPLAAQQQIGTVTGTVTAEAGTPLANAAVVLVGTARTAVTNARGEYHLSVPAGAHILRARVIGHAAGQATGLT